MAQTTFIFKVKKFLVWVLKLSWKIVLCILTSIYKILKLLAESSNASRWNSNDEEEEESRSALFGGRSSHIKTVLQLASILIKADGVKKRAELDYIKKKIEKDYSRITAESWILRIESYIEIDLNLEKIARRANYNFDQSTKIQLLHFLAGIATKDAMLTSAEYNTLKEVSMRIRIPFRTLKSILALYNYITEEEAQQKREQKKRPRETPEWRLKKSLVILELTESATDREVKKAYRKLAKLHHPDKVIHMGAQFQKAAELKFKQISEAYEAIKAKRGFA